MAQGFTTRPRFDQALRAQETAQAQLENAEAQLELARDRLGFTELRTDVAGVVTERRIEPGEVVQPGQVVFVDGGTTAVQLARHLPPALRATVVTHSPSVAVELVGHAGVEVVLIGGRLFKHSVVAVGAAAVEAIARFHADLYFMGVTGVHAQAGLSTADMEEAAVKRALMAAAGDTVVMASSEKLGAASPYVIAPLDAVATVLVAPEAPKAALAPCQPSEQTRLSLGEP